MGPRDASSACGAPPCTRRRPTPIPLASRFHWKTHLARFLHRHSTRQRPALVLLLLLLCQPRVGKSHRATIYPTETSTCAPQSSPRLHQSRDVPDNRARYQTRARARAESSGASALIPPFSGTDRSCSTSRTHPRTTHGIADIPSIHSPRRHQYPHRDDCSSTCRRTPRANVRRSIQRPCTSRASRQSFDDTSDTSPRARYRTLAHRLKTPLAAHCSVRVRLAARAHDGLQPHTRAHPYRSNPPFSRRARIVGARCRVRFLSPDAYAASAHQLKVHRTNKTKRQHAISACVMQETQSRANARRNTRAIGTNAKTALTSQRT